MLKPGDVVILDFPGATGVKRRPAIVVSTALYHAPRPDVIEGLLTTQLASANAPTDYIIEHWAAAGLRQPSAFRSYLAPVDVAGRPPAGHLTDRDWAGVQACLAGALALAVPSAGAA